MTLSLRIHRQAASPTPVRHATPARLDPVAGTVFSSDNFISIVVGLLLGDLCMALLDHRIKLATEGDRR